MRQIINLKRDIVAAAEPEDRDNDHVVALQRELPFLAHIGGQRGLWSANIENPIHLGANGILDLLMKSEPTRHERFAIEPDGEAGLL